jgi:hypothetical protein
MKEAEMEIVAGIYEDLIMKEKPKVLCIMLFMVMKPGGVIVPGKVMKECQKTFIKVCYGFHYSMNP